MCLLFAVPNHKQQIPKNFLKNAFENHGDGMGFSFAKDGKLFLEKGFFDFDKFYEAYQKTIGYPALIHARNSTSGKKNEINCHPFEVDSRVHFAHNGVIHHFNYKIQDCSDTYAFNENLLKKIAAENKTKKWWKNRTIKWWIQSAIGKGNKLAFIDSSGHIEIFNEAAGEWTDESKEIWASNGTYKQIKTRTATVWPAPPAGYSQTPRPPYSGFYDHDDDDDLAAAKRYLTDAEVEQIENEVDVMGDAGEEPIDITKLPAAELDEVDEYLAALNAV